MVDLFNRTATDRIRTLFPIGRGNTNHRSNRMGYTKKEGRIVSDSSLFLFVLIFKDIMFVVYKQPGDAYRNHASDKTDD